MNRPPSTGPAPLPTSLMAPAKSLSVTRKLQVAEDVSGRSPMTHRQQEVLFCLVEGKPTKRICKELSMSEGTAKVHIAAIFRALRVNNRTEATLAALKQGWIHPEMWSRS